MQMQMLQQLNVSAGSSYSSCKAEGVPDHFPAGMRVLLVDDDSTCLKILEQMLKKCMYSVTTCNRATHALSLLREKRCGFDMVISDVHMPDMDGFKLLEIVGLEMDLPVIMMSADGRTTTVLKGVKHGACDFLTKPVRMEELKNIWQHVVRKKWNESKDHDQSGSLEDNDKQKRTGDDAEYASSVNEGSEANWKGLKKRKESKDDEDDGEQENEDPSASKKPRVVWSVELHQQFVNAVHQLGIEKAVPKRILELMNVPGLTRENVASHLQKFRLYLKRLSGVAQSQSGICGSYGGPIEPNTKVGPLPSINIQGFAATGQIPPQTFAALHAEILSRHGGGSLVVPSVDQPALLQAALNGQNGTQLERSPTFVQPFLKAQPNLPKQFVQSNIPMEDFSSGGFVSWPQPLGTASTTNNMGGFASQNGNAVMQLHQHQQQPLQLESGNLLNVQPSCIVTPTNSSNLTSRSNVVSSSTTQNLSSQSFGGSSLLDYSLFQSVNNVSVGPGQGRDMNLKNAGLLSGYPLPGSISPSVSCSVMPQGNNSPHDWRMPSQMTHITPASQLSGLGQNTCEVSYADKSGDLLNQGLNHSHNILYKGSGFQSRYPSGNLSRAPFASELDQGPLYITDEVDIVKQEMNPDFMDNMKVTLPVFQSYSPNDLMTIYSK